MRNWSVTFATSTMTPATEALHGQLLADFRAGSKAALARAVSIVENHRDGFEEVLADQHLRLGHARRIGITGPPGAGKSTMTSALARYFRSSGWTVGIVAVDPTSPFTGGALLGDRIRMEDVALDPGVFIRSMATRGSLGGLAASTREVSDVLDGFGMDVILIETVGVGQSELDIAGAADTTLVVLVPESGDSIQTLKAGVMEIADVFVVNKADRPGADGLRRDIELMLGLRSGRAGPIRPESRQALNDSTWTAPGWIPPVLKTVASQGEGLQSVARALESHRSHLESSGELQRRRRARLKERVMDIVETQIRQRLWRDSGTMKWLDSQLEDMESGRVIPYVVADRLRSRSAALLTGAQFVLRQRPVGPGNEATADLPPASPPVSQPDSGAEN